MTFTAPRPLYTKSVAMALVITFFACMALLSAWYLVPYPQPDVALFQWCGTAFMLAYAVAETVRRASWTNFLLLAGVLAMLAADIARHFTFDLGVASYAPGPCAVSGDNAGPACALGMPLVFHYHHIVLAMSATFALKLAADLVHRLRRG